MKPLRILVVEDQDYDLDVRVAAICRDALQNGPFELVRMRVVPLIENQAHKETVEKTWQYDVIVLDLHLPIAEDETPPGTKLQYSGQTQVYGGCFVAAELARIGFQGYVLVNSAFLEDIPENFRQGLTALDSARRLFRYRKDSGILDSVLRQIVDTTRNGIDFSADLHRKIVFASTTDQPVLLLGATGTGKELIAECIHRHWNLRKASDQTAGPRPWVTINCALLGSELMRSELMGHAKGAFTGATRHKLGAVLRAAGLSAANAKPTTAPTPARVDLGRVNLAQKELKREIQELRKQPDQPIGTLLKALNEFLDSLDQATTETRKGMDLAVERATLAQNSGSEAFAAWVRSFDLGRFAMVASTSGSLDLHYHNEEAYGTLFLDEIGHLSRELQGMILRLLAERREISPLGFEGTIRLDRLRIIAATSSEQWIKFAGGDDSPTGTNADHGEAGGGLGSLAGSPSEDLYHRLAGHVIMVDSLRSSEVKNLVLRHAKARKFWLSGEGEKIIAAICERVDAGAFRGNRRELRKLVELTENFRDAMPLLGRPGGHKLSWEDILKEIWFPQRPPAKNKAAGDKRVAQDAAGEITATIKRLVQEHLPAGGWDGKSMASLKKVFKAKEHDPARMAQLRKALTQSVNDAQKEVSDRLGKKRCDEVAELAVPGAKTWRALYDGVRK